MQERNLSENVNHNVKTLMNILRNANQLEICFGNSVAKGRRQNFKPVLLSDPTTAKKGMGDLHKNKLYVLASYQIRSLQNTKKYLCIYLRTSCRATKKYKF